MNYLNFLIQLLHLEVLGAIFDFQYPNIQYFLQASNIFKFFKRYPFKTFKSM
ncbi:hypothetical protein GLOIN_2v1581533 [Rhizophagus irregularis DAOM 181602=DAOM 197198]|uniref:Uncharacterized protein n=1 Tax=Rhizophagus irregularis (strain DAOM 181602 / DAOM 197198 / MUCL 43194) TaxID=747089 RepID=A0A2P4Q874_RHIID|nr:hypothetical protein GLOIN_2v1581533 [Rhizophagus irregularis DAOM 181602=DAOM 197198]POG73841.1 hypothetical protein GLOIN_2v1581533 [Rhizophagus irregularis DAOM 181602=DAOM 197198]|eukprot:XP_025180707.1 hypothetical protein GLOIN_2v1581533 [Rhizophagus irregularis DAOM 181602=DAOM 197198]